MTPFLDSTAFRVYAAVSAVLVLKMAVLAFATATVRGVHKQYPNPEDARFLKGDHAPDHDTVARIKRAHANAMENEPLFMVLGLLYTLLGANPMGMQIYAYTFLIARVLHSICYVFKLQPFRTLSFTIGWLCLVGMSVQVLMRAFS